MALCRLIIDGPHGGAWNMAADEVLLDQASRNSDWTLRLYRWAEPTLSLGYFQSCQARSGHASSRDCAVVRRPSGGGAILHDQELTYCLIAPAGHALARDAHGLYRAVHGAFVQALAEVGVAAAMHESQASIGSSAAGPEPFLCFQRRSVGDLLIGPAKVGGSAQRRRGGGVLQHGSFLLRRSSAAPELPGIEDLHPTDLTAEAWQTLLITRLERELALEIQPRGLNDQEREAAAALAHEKYSRRSWTQRR
jgi:lipoate-protein ligase A